MMIFSRLQPCSFASLARNFSAVGFGYNRNRPSTAALTAARTFDEGGYGFSFVLSLINPLIFGCSPGTYACKSWTSGRINGLFFAMRENYASTWQMPEIILYGEHFFRRHKNVSHWERIIVDTFFLPEKITTSFRDILTTLFKYLNHRRFSGGNFRVRFFLT